MRSAFLLVVLCIAALRFVNLGAGDLGKDEALWCIRAKAVAFHGEWLDTSDHTVLGLNQSSYPPLHAWLTAPLYKAFGANEWTSRVVSAAFGALAVILVYFMGSAAFGPIAGMFAAVILGLNDDFFEFSRKGQLETLYVGTIVLSLWLYMLHSRAQLRRLATGEPPKVVTVPLLLCGVAFGLALLSKIATGLFVPIVLVPYVLYLVVNGRRRVRDAAAELGIILAVGLVIAAPWHLYMMSLYSPEHPYKGKTFWYYFWEYNVVRRTADPLAFGALYSGRGWGHLFYTQLLVKHTPQTLAMALFGMFVALRTGFSRSDRRQPTEFKMMFLLWVILTFAAVERSATRATWYVLPLIPGLALFAGWTLSEVAKGRIGPLGKAVFLGCAVLLAGYAADNHVREATETVVASMLGLEPERARSAAVLLRLLLYAAGGGLVATGYYLWAKRARWTRTAEFAMVSLILVGAGFEGAFEKVWAADADSAWSRLARVVPAKSDYDMVLSVGHWRDNRQVQYYLDGVMTRWETRPLVELRRVEPDNAGHEPLSDLVPCGADRRWWYHPEPVLLEPGTYERGERGMENLTDKSLAAIVLGEAPVAGKIEALLRGRKVLVMVVEKTGPAAKFRDVVERNARLVGKTGDLSLYLSQGNQGLER
jgi:4-amino-4-deoxy-L-arabinose transferase-like glycosyltransferase